jgi:hypothetical protein
LEFAPQDTGLNARPQYGQKKIEETLVGGQLAAGERTFRECRCELPCTEPPWVA